VISPVIAAVVAAKIGDACTFPKGVTSFLSFPHWYQYLSGTLQPTVAVSVANPNGLPMCTPLLASLADTWLVVAAIIEILIRVAALMAVAFVMYGGVSYMLSQGEPDKTAQARRTIVNALIGLALAISAAAIIAFVAGRIN